MSGEQVQVYGLAKGGSNRLDCSPSQAASIVAGLIRWHKEKVLKPLGRALSQSYNWVISAGKLSASSCAVSLRFAAFIWRLQ